jgi:hypothetical protein
MASSVGYRPALYRPIFVGREAEVQHLQSAYDDATQAPQQARPRRVVPWDSYTSSLGIAQLQDDLGSSATALRVSCHRFGNGWVYTSRWRRTPT